MLKNKKGNIMTIIIFFIILFVVLFAGFILVMSSSVVNFVFDEAMPELSSLGVIGDANMTEVADLTIVPLDNMIQSFTWLTGVIYFLMLIGSFAFAVMSRSNPSKWLMVFYFGCALLLIFGSIFISNMYEDFYDGTDDLSVRLKEHVLLSWMILYAPTIFTVIVFATGIIMFSGLGQEDFV